MKAFILTCALAVTVALTGCISVSDTPDTTRTTETVVTSHPTATTTTTETTVQR